MGIIGRAATYAMAAHDGQKRKYTGEPYFVHCAEVAALVADVGSCSTTIAVAYLHDVLEDCKDKVTLWALQRDFGGLIACSVLDLSDLDSVGNRAERKRKSCYRLGQAAPAVKTVKLADLISNTRSIVRGDPKFAKVYLQEKRELLPYLKEGNGLLYAEAYAQAYA